ncbi:protease [Gammaproteobacteria bacterium]|nr:protease [Gammaproteobacteria bacterium]
MPNIPTFAIIAIAIICLLLILAFMSITIVPQGKHYTIERFGRYRYTLEPGLGWINPLFSHVGRRLNMMEQVMDVPSQEAITRDNAMVRVDGVVFYQITDAKKAAYEITNLSHAILNLTMTNIRTVMGSMDLDELLSKRDDINLRLLSVVDHATAPWGIKVTRIEIKDIAPPKDLVEAMGQQMKAERIKRASILESEGLRASEILRAEGAKLAIILDAEGKKDAAYLEAEARERLAEAEATATRLVSDAIKDGSTQAINYFIAQKYVEAFSKIATSKSDKVIMMPMEASSLIGSLGGIAELIKSAAVGITPPKL